MARITLTIHSNVIGQVTVERFTGRDGDSSEHTIPGRWREEIEALISALATEATQIAKATSIVQETADKIANHNGVIKVGKTD